jgi:hypothetical protein
MTKLMVAQISPYYIEQHSRNTTESTRHLIKSTCSMLHINIFIGEITVEYQMLRSLIHS